MKPFVVGITGGIASGKTAVSDRLKELGACVIDADEVSRDVMAAGTPVEAELKAAFPEAFAAGSLDRGKLRSLVFADGERLYLLNGITHPAIIAELARRIEASGRDLVFAVVPLMYGTGCDGMCDRVLVVTAERETRIKRLMARNNITREIAEAMDRAQDVERERQKAADFVIANDGDLASLREETERFYRMLTAK